MRNQHITTEFTLNEMKWNVKYKLTSKNGILGNACSHYFFGNIIISCSLPLCFEAKIEGYNALQRVWCKPADIRMLKESNFANLFMLLPFRGKELANYFLDFSSYSETVTFIYIFAIPFKGTVYNNFLI